MSAFQDIRIEESKEVEIAPQDLFAELLREATSHLSKRGDAFEVGLISSDERTQTGMEKWMLVELLAYLNRAIGPAKISPGADSFADRIEGEKKYRIKSPASSRFGHCDIWIRWKNQEHWIEVKTTHSGDVKTKMRDIRTDISKRDMIGTPSIFHELVISFPMREDDLLSYQSNLDKILEPHIARHWHHCISEKCILAVSLVSIQIDNSTR